MWFFEPVLFVKFFRLGYLSFNNARIQLLDYLP